MGVKITAKPSAFSPDHVVLTLSKDQAASLRRILSGARIDALADDVQVIDDTQAALKRYLLHLAKMR